MAPALLFLLVEVHVGDASRPFVCKERAMRGSLSADEAAMAHEGVIAPALRERSPVYYWRHTTQTRSRHEAVCSKQTGWHMASFGSHGTYLDRAVWKCNRMYDRGVVKLDSCINSSIDSLPVEWRRAHNVSLSSRGAGYWRWKPYYLLERLASLEDGEVLVHLDYDLTVTTNTSALFCLGQNSARGVALFHFPCWTDREWSKAELTTALGATDAMLDTVQIYGGLVVLRKTKFALRFLHEWLRWSTTGMLIEDPMCLRWEHPLRKDRGECQQWSSRQDPAFRAHRHDQSILSLLSKVRNVKSFPLPTASHDTRDIWGWDAGYCEAEWPLETQRGGERYMPTPLGIVSHYSEMGDLEGSLRACQATSPTRAVPHLPDYIEGEEVRRKILKKNRIQRVLQQRGIFSSRRARAWHQKCSVSLVRQESRQAACVLDETVGCIRVHSANGTLLGHVIWVEGGCRGVFECESGLQLRCGRPGYPKAFSWYLCEEQFE